MDKGDHDHDQDAGTSTDKPIRVYGADDPEARELVQFLTGDWIIGEHARAEDDGSKEQKKTLTPDEFASIAFDLLGAHKVGSFKDEFGGEIIFVYRKVAKGRGLRISNNIELYSRGDQEVINRMLPQAKEEYRNRLHQKLRDAADSLAQEVLTPIYEATGLTWDREYPVPVLDQGRITAQDEIVRRELKDGHISYRKLKKSGRPSQWTPAKLERDVKRAAKKVLLRGGKLTLKNAIPEMNKRRMDQTPLTLNALKQAMVRNSLSWANIKRAVIDDRLQHFSSKKRLATE